MSFSSVVESTDDSKLSLLSETPPVSKRPDVPWDVRYIIYKFLDVNFLFTVVAKLSKSERNFIKQLRSSTIPRILRLVPQFTAEINFFNVKSLNYLFEFTDMIKLNMRCPSNCRCNSRYYCNVNRE